VAEVEGHLRAMLRDVLCGYLDGDLKGVADDILLETNPEPFVEIRARDLRTPEPEPELESEPEPQPEPEPAPEAEQDTAEMEAVAVQPELEGVTQSADWGFDDPEDFSAPV
jgi:outer membrane biosynthesis protein TonB